MDPDETSPGSRPRSPPSAAGAWTGEARSSQTTVAIRDFVQVLLVVVLSVVEGLGLHDLRGDGSQSALCQDLEGQPRSAKVRAVSPLRWTVWVSLSSWLQSYSINPCSCVCVCVCPMPWRLTALRCLSTRGS